VQSGLEFLFGSALESLLQDLEDVGFRAAVDEDDEAEAELLLIDLVQVGELGQDRRMAAAALLGGRALREVASADRRVRVQCLSLLLLCQLRKDLLCRSERVVSLGEELDQPRAALEQLRELVGGQLPR